MRLVAYCAGIVAEEREFDNWAGIGGKIGNLVGDVDTIRVFDGETCLLFYCAGGLFCTPEPDPSVSYDEAELEAAMATAENPREGDFKAGFAEAWSMAGYGDYEANEQRAWESFRAK